jgi:hypothetical protein
VIDDDVEITLDIVAIGETEPINGKGPAVLRHAAAYLYRMYGSVDSDAMCLLAERLVVAIEHQSEKGQN